MASQGWSWETEEGGGVAKVDQASADVGGLAVGTGGGGGQRKRSGEAVPVLLLLVEWVVGAAAQDEDRAGGPPGGGSGHELRSGAGLVGRGGGGGEPSRYLLTNGVSGIESSSDSVSCTAGDLARGGEGCS